MKELRNLITAESSTRRLLTAQVQSALGTGAAYVALLVIAYQRFRSPLAVSAILLCEFLPSMLFGAVFGAAADRWSRRTILIASELIRAIAFLGLAWARSFEAIVALAALAGAGQAAFQPAVMASLPALVGEELLAPLTGVYGAVQEFGLVAGPVLAAGAFMFIHPSGVLLANAITFGVSAVLLSTLPVGRTGAETAGLGRKRSLLTSALDGARALRRNRAASTVVLSSALFVCFLGTVNVTELVLVRTGLRGGAAGYAVVVAMMGVGVTAGSLIAGRRDHCATGPRLYLAGIALCAAGMAGCALAPNLGIALIAFLAMGLGNGIALVSENIILQQVIPGDIKGRVFGLKASLISSAFLVSYVGGGVLVNAIGPRATFGVIAAGSVLVLAIARTVLAVQRVQPLRTAASQASG